MKKVLIAVAVTLLAGAGTLAATSEASAQYRHRHHHHHRGPGIAPLIGGLAAGAIIGGAIASSRPAYAEPPPAYYAPRYAPAPVEYYEEPVCTIEQQQYWDGFNWRVRNIRVCD